MYPFARRRPRRLSSLVICLLAAYSSGCAVHKELLEKEPVDLAVEHLIEAIDQAVELAYQHHGDDLGLSMTEVSVALQTTVDKNAGQDLTISVLEIEAAEDESFTQTLTLTLDPPDTTPKASAAPSRARNTASPEIVERLSRGIEAAILAAKGARKGIELTHPGSSPLATKKIQVAMEFSLSTTGDGVPTVSILGIDLTAERSRKRVHTVTLTFKIKDDRAPKH